MDVEFQEFAKIARLSRDCVITEKIDGTNAQVHVQEDGTVLAGSRNRYLREAESDNFGFGAWVRAHEDELRQLGPGRHYGEWWGSGIGRKYGLVNGEKRFSLFNVARWVESWKGPEGDKTRGPLGEKQEYAPDCCYVVPVLYMGIFTTYYVTEALSNLKIRGSRCAPGFMRPEGVVIWHEAARVLFKKTVDGDEAPKGVRA